MLWTVARIELGKTWSQRTLPIAILVLAPLLKLLAVFELDRLAPEAQLDDIRLNGFYLATRSGRAVLALCAVLLFIDATQRIAAEAERGQLRMTLTRPVRRTTLYLGRLLALCVLIAAIVAFDLLLGIGVGFATRDFADVADVSMQGEQFGATALWGDLLRAYGLTALGLGAVASLGLCLSAWFRRAVSALTTGLLVLAGLALVALVFGDPLASFLPTTWVWRPLETMEKLTSGTSLYREPAEAFQATLACLGSFALTAAAGAWTFTRKEHGE
jgi:ABC-type transport system involved in multi-copper enzyme maturation permease subunit